MVECLEGGYPYGIVLKGLRMLSLRRVQTHPAMVKEAKMRH